MHRCAYGSMSATRNRLISIIASASMYYEREICVRLQIAGIYTPDASCSRNGASFTDNFNTVSACRGNDNLLADFSNWIQQRRKTFGIDANTIVHLFTGADKVTSTIGCAYTSSVRYIVACVP
jgi:Metallo-peptidase family M12B Reprolysin-like